MAPRVSIILPSYNRERYLRRVFDCIRGQTYADWELIVVDDGSTDDTARLTTELSRDIKQNVVYVHQENQGAYGARNVGLDWASGSFVAFFDSDDLWTPDHLRDCVALLDEFTHIDWAFGNVEINDEVSGRIVNSNYFGDKSHAQPFLKLHSVRRGAFWEIADEHALNTAIRHSICCGLQHSVIRRTVFEENRFDVLRRNEAEDQLFVIRALGRGVRFAYSKNIHLRYFMHGENSSAVTGSVEKRRRVVELLIDGFERLPSSVVLNRGERRALRTRLSEEYFWRLGYSILWQNGRRGEALAMFQRGLHANPWRAKYWKTYLLAKTRHWLTAAEIRTSDSAQDGVST